MSDLIMLWLKLEWIGFLIALVMAIPAFFYLKRKAKKDLTR